MTGATGFVGGALARRLCADGHQVTALVRTPSAARDLVDLGVEIVPGDLDDVSALDRLLEGTDGFFHVAGWFKYGRRERTTLARVNVEGTRNALDAALRAEVRTVYTSTTAINSDTRGRTVDESYRFDGRHLSEYDRTKAIAHEVALEYVDRGLELVIVQPSVVYGPGDTSTLGAICRRITEGRLTPGPKGGGVSWTHVDDVADGHLLAMAKGRPGESYILAGEQATHEIALTDLARQTGGRAPLFAPRAVVRTLARLNAGLELLVRLPSDQTPEAMRSATATYYGDSTKAGTELGWTARSLRQGFEDTFGTG